MKTIRKHLILISLFFSFTFLFQSCKVYHTKTSTVDEVIESQKRVKVKTYNDETYMFDKLQRENEQLYGIKKVKNQELLNIYTKQFGQGEHIGKEVRFLILDDAFKEYHLQNKGLGTAITILVPVVIVGALVVWVSYEALSF